MNLIRLKTARKMLIPGSRLDIGCWSRKGELCHYRDAIITSFSSKPDTVNIMIEASREVRKIRLRCIFEINNLEVCL